MEPSSVFILSPVLFPSCQPPNCSLALALVVLQLDVCNSFVTCPPTPSHCHSSAFHTIVRWVFLRHNCDHYCVILLLRAFHDFPLPTECKCLSLAFKAFPSALSSTSCLQVLSTQPDSGFALRLKHLILLPAPHPAESPTALVCPSLSHVCFWTHVAHLFCFAFSYLWA